MEEIEYRIEMWRQKLYNEINNNKELCTSDILKLSQKLDKIIAEAYKQELSTNINTICKQVR